MAGAAVVFVPLATVIAELIILCINGEISKDKALNILKQYLSTLKNWGLPLMMLQQIPVFFIALLAKDKDLIFDSKDIKNYGANILVIYITYILYLMYQKYI